MQNKGYEISDRERAFVKEALFFIEMSIYSVFSLFDIVVIVRNKLLKEPFALH